MIHGVEIGDKFRWGKHLMAEVVDILECRSSVNGEILRHICIARPLNGLANNNFDVPFSTVVRNKEI